MHHFNFILGLLAVSLAKGQGLRCGNEDGLLAAQAEAAAPLRMRFMREAAGLVEREPAPPPINLFMHIIAASDKREDGYLTVAEVDRQVEIIKTIYTKYGITFNHNPSTQRKWTTKPEWTGESRDFNPMKEALHQGDYRTLNVYLRPIAERRYGGTCTNPWTESWRTPDLKTRLLRDGCVINQVTLDGSDHEFMNKGLTAVHEIGHWFGLFHPWEGNTANGNPCSLTNPDDHVTDTPKMLEIGEGLCDESQDTCNQENDPKLKDPVHNYMTYSADSCYTEFSPLQKERMYYIYDAYRTNLTIT